jgi:hypothetical protein
VGKKDFHPVGDPLGHIIAMDRDEGKTSLLAKGGALKIGIDRTPARANPKDKWPFALIWSRADVIGLFSNNVGPFSRNVVPSGPLFSINLVPKQRCFWAEPFMFSGRYTYPSA